MDRLRAMIEEHMPEVVVLDPLRALHTKDENNSQSMEELWFAIREQLIREHGLTVIIAHHLRKGAKADHEAARGGSWQENVATSWLLMANPRDPGGQLLLPTKTRNGSPIPKLALFRHPDTLLTSARPAEDETATDDLLDRAALILSDRGDAAMRLDELAEKLEQTGRTRKDQLWAALQGDDRFTTFQLQDKGRPRAVQLCGQGPGF
jgi:RecA-family ATPase